MNLAKSIFVMAYMTAMMVFSAIAIWQLFRITGENSSQDVLAWGGVLLTVLPLLLVINYMMMLQNSARTSNRFPIITVLAFAGLGLSAIGASMGAPMSALLMSGAGLVMFVAYNWWYSSFGRKPNARIAVGEVLPSFPIKNVRGETVTSETLRDKPTVWLFFRGNWCPLCMAQVKEIAGAYKQLEGLGARVALVSPQPHNNTLKLARKHDVGMEFFTDEDIAAGRALGIFMDNAVPKGMEVMGYDSDSVMPTVIITDTSGKVVWVDETDNYRVRPEPATFLDVLKKENLVRSVS